MNSQERELQKKIRQRERELAADRARDRQRETQRPDRDRMYVQVSDFWEKGNWLAR